MARVIGYVRVSTEEQALDGVGLDVQERAIRDYCRTYDLELVRLAHDNGVSGKTIAKREGLQRALEEIRAGDADGIVFLKLDRLSRSVRDVLDLAADAQRSGWQLHSIHERLDTSTPGGRFTLTVLAALAQMEREQISERTRSALAELRRQGRRVSGRAPFGYRFADGKLEEVLEEQRLLSRMLALQAEGLGAQRISSELNGEGRRNPRTGRAWSRGSVASILATVARAIR